MMILIKSGVQIGADSVDLNLRSSIRSFKLFQKRDERLETATRIGIKMIQMIFSQKQRNSFEKCELTICAFVVVSRKNLFHERVSFKESDIKSLLIGHQMASSKMIHLIRKLRCLMISLGEESGAVKKVPLSEVARRLVRFYERKNLNKIWIKFG